MSMPGFNADVTLYRASENYRGAVAGEGVARGDVVIPQFRMSTPCAVAISLATSICNFVPVFCDLATSLARGICKRF